MKSYCTVQVKKIVLNFLKKTLFSIQLYSKKITNKHQYSSKISKLLLFIFFSFPAANKCNSSFLGPNGQSFGSTKHELILSFSLYYLRKILLNMI